jgi:hypothetical protein
MSLCNYQEVEQLETSLLSVVMVYSTLSVYSNGATLIVSKNEVANQPMSLPNN